MQAVGVEYSLSLSGGFLGCSKNSKETREARAERTRENM